MYLEVGVTVLCPLCVVVLAVIHYTVNHLKAALVAIWQPNQNPGKIAASMSALKISSISTAYYHTFVFVTIMEDLDVLLIK